MNHWPFILGAYAFTAVAVLSLLWASWSAMRKGEAEAEQLRGSK